jgi:hypothetical protein
MNVEQLGDGDQQGKTEGLREKIESNDTSSTMSI